MFLESVEAASSISFRSMNEWANIETMMRKHIEENFLRRCESGVYVVDYDLVSTRASLKPDTRIVGNTCPSYVDFFFRIKGVIIPIGTLVFGMRVDEVGNGMIIGSGEIHHGDYIVRIKALVEQKHYVASPVPAIGALINVRIANCRYTPKDQAVKVSAEPMKSLAHPRDVCSMFYYVNPTDLTDRIWMGLEAALKFASRFDASPTFATRFNAFVAASVTPFIADIAPGDMVKIAKRSDFAALAPGYYYHVQTTTGVMTLGKLKSTAKKTMQSSAHELMGLCMSHAQFVYSLVALA